MDLTSLLISLVSGGVGGNIAGAAMKDKSLGTLGNSIAGVVGGGLGGTILQVVMGMATQGDGISLGSVLGNVAGSGVGGAVLMIVVALIKGAMAKKA